MHILLKYASNAQLRIIFQPLGPQPPRKPFCGGLKATLGVGGGSQTIPLHKGGGCHRQLPPKDPPPFFFKKEKRKKENFSFLIC
jgi:hypothetical protein